MTINNHALKISLITQGSSSHEVQFFKKEKIWDESVCFRQRKILEETDQSTIIGYFCVYLASIKEYKMCFSMTS